MVDAENYLLCCYRYIELNPVKAKMVSAPEEYPWSSYRSNALGQQDDLLSPHHLYQLIAIDEVDRWRCYRKLFTVALSEPTNRCLNDALEKCPPRVMIGLYIRLNQF